MKKSRLLPFLSWGAVSQVHKNCWFKSPLPCSFNFGKLRLLFLTFIVMSSSLYLLYSIERAEMLMYWELCITAMASSNCLSNQFNSITVLLESEHGLALRKRSEWYRRCYALSPLRRRHSGIFVRPSQKLNRHLRLWLKISKIIIGSFFLSFGRMLIGGKNFGIE